MRERSLDTVVSEFENWIYRSPSKQHSTYFLFPDGSPTCDTYLRYEHLDQDLQGLCETIGIAPQQLLKTKNKCRPRNLHYSELYTQRTRDFVEECHSKTIRYFGYEF